MTIEKARIAGIGMMSVHVPASSGLSERLAAEGMRVYPARERVEAEVARIKAEAQVAENRSHAKVLDTFWQGMLETQKDGKLHLELEVRERTGDEHFMRSYSLNPSQVREPDRSHPVWRGTVVDSGTNEASVIVTKTLPDGKTERTVVRVSPFSYQTEAGSTGYKLRPEALTQDNPSTRGAIFRNKQEF